MTPDTQAYLRAVIKRLPGAKLDEIDALLPANWAAANRDAHPVIKSNTAMAA